MCTYVKQKVENSLHSWLMFVWLYILNKVFLFFALCICELACMVSVLHSQVWSLHSSVVSTAHASHRTNTLGRTEKACWVFQAWWLVQEKSLVSKFAMDQCPCLSVVMFFFVYCNIGSSFSKLSFVKLWQFCDFLSFLFFGTLVCFKGGERRIVMDETFSFTSRYRMHPPA